MGLAQVVIQFLAQFFEVVVSVVLKEWRDDLVNGGAGRREKLRYGNQDIAVHRWGGIGDRCQGQRDHLKGRREHLRIVSGLAFLGQEISIPSAFDSIAE